MPQRASSPHAIWVSSERKIKFWNSSLPNLGWYRVTNYFGANCDPYSKSECTLGAMHCDSDCSKAAALLGELFPAVSLQHSCIYMSSDYSDIIYRSNTRCFHNSKGRTYPKRLHNHHNTII